MATIETCDIYSICGFATLLKKITGTANPDCEKNSAFCGRLGPNPPFKLETESALSDEEIKTAYPVLYYDEKGKPRRVLKGTHR
jgi:hypothetical protein